MLEGNDIDPDTQMPFWVKVSWRSTSRSQGRVRLGLVWGHAGAGAGRLGGVRRAGVLKSMWRLRFGGQRGGLMSAKGRG
eukprot:117863-Rhodomonas_salina.1